MKVMNVFIPIACCSFLLVNLAERSDDWGLDGIESTLSEPGVETSQQYVQLKLEETCVLVDGDELHFVLHKEGKRRPYKVLSRSLCVRA